MLKLPLIVSTILMVTAFDVFLASDSIAPLRFIYDIAFAMIAFVVTYVSILLLRNKEFPKTSFLFSFPRITFIFAILLNFRVVLSTFWLGIPSIGSLGKNFIIQGAYSLVPLLDYVLLVVVNGIILCVAVNRKLDLHVCEVPTYVLGVIAIEACFTVYGFQFAGISGMRLCISLFHIGICGVILWSYKKLGMRTIRMKFDFPSILVLLLSVGLLMMMFIPYGIYNLYDDSSVIVGSALSITQRSELQSYYKATDYYSPIGGFVVTIFAYSSGLNNILLACNLPFLASYLMLPFIIYFFLKKFITNDPRIALIGTIVTALMDGLAVLLLPAYAGNITTDTITWSISPATMSLHQSSMYWFWTDPYKIFGLTASIAVVNVLGKRGFSSLLLSGALLALSFTNPRQPFVALLLLIFLLGTKRISLTELSAIILSLVLSLGPIFPATIYKIEESSLTYLLSSSAWASVARFSANLVSSVSFLIIALAVATLLLGISYEVIYNSERQKAATSSKLHFLDKKLLFKIEKGGSTYHLGLSELAHNRPLFLGLTLIMLAYCTLYSYGILPTAITRLAQNPLIQPLNYLLLRYHILIILVIVGFLEFSSRVHTLRTLVTLSFLSIAIYLGLSMPNTMLHVPLVITIMALPALASLVNTRKKVETCLVLLLVILGIFSTSFYSATVKKTEVFYQPVFDDLPSILPLLIKQNSTSVFSVPSDDGDVVRVVESMANLNLTLDQSCPLWIIDTRYTESAEVRNLLSENGTKVLYQGEVFILLERTP